MRPDAAAMHRADEAYADAAVRGLAELRLRGFRCADCDATPVGADALPDDYQRLLVHHDHMTARLQEFHGVAVRLDVLQERAEDHDAYGREILLRRADDGRVVEYGAVRIALGALPEAVRAEIRAKQTPLGEILIRHDLLRRIEPRWYYAISPEIVEEWRGDAAAPVYGRRGTIFYRETPVIEVLEVVRLLS